MSVQTKDSYTLCIWVLSTSHKYQLSCSVLEATFNISEEITVSDFRAGANARDSIPMNHQKFILKGHGFTNQQA
jgi:hypothetical protein